ncbi:MAG: HAD-IIA family hydrolase [Sneathiella sp.]|nr:HAD-IIA family hydrolase [Sneathiella sp.]
MQSYNNFEDLFPRLTGEQAFELYEEVKDKLPKADFPASSLGKKSLMDVADQVDTFVFDAFGVLNVGETTLDGAVQRIADLRALKKNVFVLTNASSFNKSEAFAKFQKLGFDFSENEIVTSRNAAENALASFGTHERWGVAATDKFEVSELSQNAVKLNDNAEDYDAVSAFLFLSVQSWTAARQEMLEASLKDNQRPVLIANPDIVAPRGDVFSTEPGYFGHRLMRLLGSDVQFHGKPFPSVFEIVEDRLSGSNIEPNRICMVGDTLHTDILGGAARGWKTALVTDHGLFKGLDPNHYIARSGIIPDWMVGSI